MKICNEQCSRQASRLVGGLGDLKKMLLDKRKEREKGKSAYTKLLFKDSLLCFH